MSYDESLDLYHGDQPRPLEPTTEALPTLEPVPDDGKRRACRHIMTDGRRCGSPALRREDFCYYHHTTRRPAPRGGAINGTIQRKHSVLDLPRPEDRSAVQHSIGEVLRMIAEDGIDPRRAGLLLYGLQIASHNLPRENPKATPEETVDEVTLDPVEGLLAMPADYENAHRPRTLEEILNEQWDREKALMAEDEAREQVRREAAANEDFAAKPGEGVS